MSEKKNNNTEKSLVLVPSPLTPKQLLMILQKTPKEHIYRRPAKGKGEWEYVTGVYVKKILNYIFGWMWDFEIKEHGREKAEDGEMVWVLGRLTIKDKEGKPMIIKEQFGRADVKFKRGTKIPLDFGNDLKAAATDALKKCASELGIASDVYGRNEFKEIQEVDKGFVIPKENGKEIERETKNEIGPKKAELLAMLRGKTEEEKIADLKKRTGIVLRDFNITERHAAILIASLLNREVKK